MCFSLKHCHEDVILTRKCHNCAGTAFVQGDSAGGSKLVEKQTLHAVVILKNGDLQPNARNSKFEHSQFSYLEDIQIKKSQ